MVLRVRRAVVISSGGFATSALRAAVHALGEAHAEVIVAIEGADPLAQRWMSARATLGERAHVTPLTPCPGLVNIEDRCSALRARLDQFDFVLVDDPCWLAPLRVLGIEARYVTGLSASTPECKAETRTRALLVTRAQPFHRGHLALVEHALGRCDELVLVIAAAERAYTQRDPYTAGERLSLVRAALGASGARIWLAALPAPGWPAMALTQLAFLVPPFQVVVAHNPILRAMAEQEGKRVEGLAEPLSLNGHRLSGSAIRARLEAEGAGAWLDAFLPSSCAAALRSSPSLAERCALIARAGD